MISPTNNWGGGERGTENSFDALQKTLSELQVDIQVTQAKLYTGHNEDKQSTKSEQVIDTTKKR
jgi:hypothetical protein